MPPWCFPCCPISPFLPPWCFPGAMRAVQLVLSCLAGASLVIWTAWGTREAPGRQERINWIACEAPGRHQGGRKEPFRQLGRHQGGTRETCSTGLPIEFRFWKGAGFCITFKTISMAIGLVRGTSWGGLHGWLPVGEAPGRQERINWIACEAPARHQGGRKEPFGQLGRHQGGARETCSTGLPIEFRFWKGAGFCITLTQFQWRSARFAANPGVGSTVGCP